MKTQELIRLFLAGETKGRASNSRIEKRENGRTVFMHYNTVLAEIQGPVILLNRTRYSVSTSKVQTWLGGAAAGSFRDIIRVDEHVPIGTQSLIPLVQFMREAK